MSKIDGANARHQPADDCQATGHAMRKTATDSAAQRARAAKGAAAKRQHRGRAAHPSNTLDANYSDNQLAFLKALDAWRRRTLATAPDARGLAEIMQALGYTAGTVNDHRFNVECELWRHRNGRRFPPAIALFDLATGLFGYRQEGRP